MRADEMGVVVPSLVGFYCFRCRILLLLGCYSRRTCAAGLAVHKC